MSGDLIPVYLERGAKLVFASALDWPGWCRRGKSEAEALAALASYAARYGEVVRSAGETLPSAVDGGSFDVVERLAGGSGTDFGVAGLSPAADSTALGDEELARQLRILDACWDAFDRAADVAVGRELRRGPRGGGRDLGRIEGHVREAEDAYLNQLGARPSKPTSDARADRTDHRLRVTEALKARARGEQPVDPSNTRNRWTPRHFVRRACWHLLDHAWEIEDRLIGD